MWRTPDHGLAQAMFARGSEDDASTGMALEF